MSSLPSGARFEAEIAGGIALWDVSHLLPRGRQTWKTKRAPGSVISVALVHHSGALGAPGFQGALNSVRFMVSQRSFPMSGYHYWSSYAPIIDPEGRLVWLRLAADEKRAWHSGRRANDIGVGWALQGNTTRMPISPSQVELLEAGIPWLMERHKTTPAEGLGWHSIADRFGGRPKKACPGAGGERYLRDYVKRAA